MDDTPHPHSDVYLRGAVIDEHACPVCGTPVAHVYRPGRGRVYCTTACRQRAYRWRRARGIRLCVERHGPAERSMANGRRHALRDPRDPVSTLADARRREVTVCGTFARPARLGRFTHDDFLPDHPWSCDSCIALVGAAPPTPTASPRWPSTRASGRGR